MQGSDSPPCVPGDLLVIPTADGYLIGRVLPTGPGPWWEYLIRAKTLSVAVRVAQDFAYAVGSRAWTQETGSEYHEITLKGP